MNRLVIGTRGSALALTQSEWVAARLREAAPDTEVVLEIIRTAGDKITDVALSKIGGKGLFTKELEVALLEGRVDLAVHSLKDLPTELPPGLALGAVPAREAPADALVSRDGLGFEKLPAGARVGTSSLRRAWQLLARRPDLDVVDLRGNVPTRVRKVEEGALDAAVLAAAGLRRLGMEAAITELLPEDIMLSAPGQGALGIEVRAGDEQVLALLAHIRDDGAMAEVTAERALLAALGGGCQVPIGARACVTDGALTLHGCVCGPGGADLLRVAVTGAPEDAAELGRRAAGELLARGAGELIARVTGAQSDAPLRGVRLVVTRAEEQSGDFVRRLESLGAGVFTFPAIAVRTRDGVPFAGTTCAVDWLVFTSRNAVESFREVLEREGRDIGIFRATRICVVGPGTARAVDALGLPVALMAGDQTGEGVLAALKAREGALDGKHILLPRGDKARPVLRDGLRAAGAIVTDLVVYETVAPDIPEETVEALLAFDPRVVTFTSSSTCANFCARLGPERLDALKARTVFASIGPITTETARAHGLDVQIAPETYDIPSLTEAIVAYCRRAG